MRSWRGSSKEQIGVEIGQTINERQAQAGWGSKVIERLADDLRHEFSDMKGLSQANLFYMRAFADAYQDKQIVQQLAGQIPWWHNVVIITRIKDPKLHDAIRLARGQVEGKAVELRKELRSSQRIFAAWITEQELSLASLLHRRPSPPLRSPPNWASPSAWREIS